MGFAKPCDVGTGRVCASFLRDGSWLSISTYHPDHGIVELSGMPPFKESTRGDPVATRRYRELMADRDSAFLWLEGASVVDVRTEAAAGSDTIRLRLSFARGDAAPVLRVRGRLDRPALAEITETHPPAATGAVTILEPDGSVVRIVGPDLRATAEVIVTAEAASIATVWRATNDDSAELRLPETDAVEVAVRLRVDAEPSAATQSPAPSPQASPQPAPRASSQPAPPAKDVPRLLSVTEELAEALDRTTLASIEYIRGCTALITGPGERTILTDHRLLPLSWTRDAYWQARLLMAASEVGVGADGISIVEDHLRWLWLRAERPDGAWVRSHHANGRRKDLPYQADQQLYPMLELADFARLTGTLPGLSGGARWSDLISEAWAVIERSRDPVSGLMRSDENASDDPALLPLIIPSQILGWYTASRLVDLEVSIGLGLDVEALTRFASEMRSGIATHATVEGPDGPVWAYAIDGRGRAARFHDCGDLPTAMGPIWGFCSADDPIWRATMAFAFSPANPAYARGPLGGLGSPHTPGTWPLGDLQEWVFSSMVGDETRAVGVLARALSSAADDAMLPEAYDPVDGRFVARHWFAWPGSSFGVLWLLDRQGRLDGWRPITPVAP